MSIAISNMSTLSMGAYDRYRLDANNRVRTDAELAEYVEDRVRKTAEYQRDHYDFWYKILSDEARTSSSVLFWFTMDSHWLTRMVKNIGLQLMTKNLWLCRSSSDQLASGIQARAIMPMLREA